MLIKYNNNNVHALPSVKKKMVTLVNKKTGKKRTVVKLDLSQSPQDIKFLRPGWNEFPREVWEQNKEHPQILKMLAEGKIELMSEVVVVKSGSKKTSLMIGESEDPLVLKQLEVPKAVKIIKGTFNREMLQRWQDDEIRSTVKKAITEQLDPLLNPKKSGDSDWTK